MKQILALSLLVISMSSFSQVFLNPSFDDLEHFTARVEFHLRETSIIEDFISEVESKYDVECSNEGSVLFLTLNNRTTFKTYCYGEVTLKVKVVSKTQENIDGSFEFRVIKKVIKRK